MMNDENEVLIERATAFVQAVAAQAPWAEIEPYYAPDVSQEEFPNRLLPKGAVRNLKALRDSSAKNRKVIKAQTIEIVNAVWSGQCVVLRRSGPARWRSTSAR
jgi:predicted metal-dependent hydrolase